MKAPNGRKGEKKKQGAKNQSPGKQAAQTKGTTTGTIYDKNSSTKNWFGLVLAISKTLDFQKP
jgi:hypothetical protein